MKPRLGLLGGGWIARSRMAALRAAGKATIAGIADPSPTVLSAALVAAPEAEAVVSLEKLLDLELDGVVITTKGLSAIQAKVALDQGLAVFCPFPIGRSPKEAANVVEAAERADRLLGFDRRYRYSDALRRAQEIVSQGEVGDIYALVLELHTPEKLDLRPQLVDALGCIMRPERIRDARMNGTDLRIDFTGGAVADISIASHPSAERAGFVAAELYGTSGTVSFESAAEPHGDPALLSWVEKLAQSTRFSADEVEGAVETASILDTLSRRSGVPSRKTATA